LLQQTSAVIESFMYFSDFDLSIGKPPGINIFNLLSFPNFLHLAIDPSSGFHRTFSPSFMISKPASFSSSVITFISN